MTDQQLLTPDQVTAYLRDRGMTVSAHTVRKAIKSGQLPGHIVGTRYVVPLPQLERWITGPEVEAPEPTPLNATVHRFLARRAS